MMKIFLLALMTLGTTAHATPWGYCQGTLAYHDAGFTSRKPDADPVCALPTARDAKDPDAVTGRCAKKQEEVCQVGAGGLEGGDNEVPREAYFRTRADVGGERVWVRCPCGCFTKDVMILTTRGWMPIGDMVAQNPDLHLRVAIPSFDAPLSASEVLRQKDFTVGPEDKPVLVIQAGDQRITMTDGHPIVVIRDERKDMVQAKTLQIGDQMLGLDGTPLTISAIDPLILPAHDKQVFNLNTRGATAAQHMMGANGFMVGDVVWQNYLSTQESRAANLMGE